MLRDDTIGSEQSPPSRCGSSFPLLWLLLPQIAAYAFCSSVAWSAEISSSRHLIAGLLFLLLTAFSVGGEYFSKEKSLREICAVFWKIFFPLSAFFIFCAWWNLSVPPVEDWSEKSPRYAEMEFCVEKSYTSSEKNFNGIARVENVFGDSASELAGARIWFSLPKKNYPDFDTPPCEGMYLRAEGILSGISLERFSSESFVGFLKRERISAALAQADSIEIVSRKDGSFVRLCAKIRSSLRENLLKISDLGETFSRVGRVLGAMLLGDRSLLLPEQKENFLLTGTMHIFAVSGLHISILAGGALLVFRFLRTPRIVAWLVTLFGLWVYVRIVGAPPSAMRAWQMFAFLFLGTCLGRGRRPFHGLIFSAFVALTLDPLVLGNIGFRLSYLVVAAILLYGVPAAERLEALTDFRRWIPEPAFSRPQKLMSRLLQSTVSAACISFAAFVAGTPCVVSMFGMVTLLSLISNVLLIPLVSVAACVGAAALLCSCIPLVGTFLGKGLFVLSALPLILVDRITGGIAALPGVFEISFPLRGLGAAGSLVLLALFFFGETSSALRERPWLRFVLPPLVLAVFLLVFSV